MERSLSALKPPTRWVGHRIDVHQSVDSTNRIAEELARDGAPEGVVVIADQQTAGRGRLGRSFFSPGGSSLYFSLVLRPECVPEQLHEYVFAAAVAVAECARSWLPAGVPVEIKWPNDEEQSSNHVQVDRLTSRPISAAGADCVMRPTEM